jgi:hypothetical protein
MSAATMRTQALVPYATLAASITVMAFAALVPKQNDPVAAIFPPWWTAARGFEAAALSGVPIVRTGAFANILVLAPGQPNLPARLHAAGAWMVVDAMALGGCAGTL